MERSKFLKYILNTIIKQIESILGNEIKLFRSSRHNKIIITARDYKACYITNIKMSFMN